MAEPATDAEIENWRSFIAKQSTIRGRVMAQTIAPLIARIDAERVALENAEARVKALEGALLTLMTVVDKETTYLNTRCFDEALVIANAILVNAVLKTREAGNG